MVDLSALSGRAGWGLWLWWVLACTVGWGVGGQVGAALDSYRNIMVTGFLAVAVGGVLAGVLQWLVLRPHVAGAGWWVPSSILAAIAVGVVAFGVGLVNADVGWVGAVGMLGTVLGVLQWLILRGQFTGAGWWVLACTVGWVVGMPVGGFVGWAGLGATYGATSGAALVWLLRQA